MRGPSGPTPGIESELGMQAVALSTQSSGRVFRICFCLARSCLTDAEAGALCVDWPDNGAVHDLRGWLQVLARALRAQERWG